MDLFQGQYRSSTQCLGCGFRSTTFNPFTCLSLPLPYKKRCISVIVHFHRDEKNQKQPHHYKLLVPQRGAVGELKEILAKACDVSRSRLVIFGGSSNSSVLRVTYDDYHPIKAVRSDRPLIAFEWPEKQYKEHEELEKRKREECNHENKNSTSWLFSNNKSKNEEEKEEDEKPKIVQWKMNERVDCRDVDGKWFCGTIRKIFFKTTDGQERQYARIVFDGYGEHWAEDHPFPDGGAPGNTNTVRPIYRSGRTTRPEEKYDCVQVIHRVVTEEEVRFIGTPFLIWYV